MEEEKPWDSEPPSISFIDKPLYSQSSEPLFSTIVAFYSLILLYFPSHFLSIAFSPVLIFTATLLLTLLRLGAIHRTDTEIDSSEEGLHRTIDSPSDEAEEEEVEDRKIDSSLVETISDPNPEMRLDFDSDPKQLYSESFVEWNLRAPLEVIYEAYEGEEEDQDSEEEEDCSVKEKEERCVVRDLERYPSLSLYYPESDDSDSSSDGDFPFGGWDSPESICCFSSWEELGKMRREELIEIALDDDDHDHDGKKKSELMFQVEEDNLIEIRLI